MSAKRMLRLRRWTRLAVIVGVTTQAATCLPTADQISQQLSGLSNTAVSLALRQIGNSIADSVFFLLDNFLVRQIG